MPDSKYFAIPFATSGDRATIPEDVQPSGAISYTQGFGPDYERNPATDPLAKRVPRDETNEYLYEITNSLKYLQLYGLPEWYTGVIYPLNARVRHLDAGWVSIAATNTATPGTDENKWVLFNPASGANSDIAVKGWQTTPPGSPARGDQYVVLPTGTGAWDGRDNHVATWSGTAWTFVYPVAGLQVQYWSGRQIVLKFNGTGWSEDLASDTAAGRVELATLTEAQNGTVVDRALPPSAFQGAVHTALFEPDVSVTPSAIVINPVPAVTSLPDGLEFLVRLANGSTGATTINISGLGAISVTYMDGAAITAGDLVVSEVLHLVIRGGAARIVTKIAANTSRRGLVELATSAEAIAGLDAERAVTPAGLLAALKASGVGWRGILYFPGVVGTGSYGFSPEANGLVTGQDKILILAWGGGGGGCSIGGTYGASGAGGGFTMKVATAVGVTILTGAGGAGNDIGGAGGAGGTSSFGSVCSATGGEGGTAGPSNGGTGVGGDVNMTGGSGSDITVGLLFAPGGSAPFMGNSLINPGGLGANPVGSGGAAFNAPEGHAAYNGQPGAVIVIF